MKRVNRSGTVLVRKETEMKKKILIVDDEMKVRRMYSSLLKSEGYRVFSASSAVEADDILGKRKIDLVLLDINMPEIDGSLLHQVMDTFHKNAKIIVCSVRPLDDQRKLIDNAADYYDKSQGI